MKECRVCALPASERRGVDAALALKIHGLAWIARRFLNLSRRDVRHHRDHCLGPNPLIAVVRARGWTGEDDELVVGEVVADVEAEEVTQ